MNIYFMLAFTRETKAPNSVLVDLFDLLRQRGHEVEIGVADEMVLGPTELSARHDLYILKSHSALWMSLAGILHAQGARMLNPYLSCLAAHNKIVAERRMEAFGIPTPASWVTGDLNLLRAVSEERPLIIKPYIGGRGVGVMLVRDCRDLAEIAPPQQPMLIQEYITGAETKVYVIGDQVFGIRKVETPSGTFRTPCALSDAARTIALRCGEAFGLGLYGLDVIESAAGPVVIDLNYFPSYKGVPNAAALLADYINDYASARSPELTLHGLYRLENSLFPVSAARVA